MNYSHKKYIARVLLPFLLLFAVITPMKEAKAFVPVAVAVAVYGGDAAAGVVGGLISGAGGISSGAVWAGLIGTVISMISMQDSQGNKIQVPLTNSPIKSPTAAQSVGATNSWPVAAGTSPQATNCGGNQPPASTPETTGALACDQVTKWASWQQQGNCTAYLPTTGYYNGANGFVCSGNASAGYIGTIAVVVTCAAGYVSDGGTGCTLSNPWAAVSDKTQTFTKNGTSFSPISGDQVGTIVGIQGTTNSPNDTLTFSQNNGGTPSNIIVTLNPGGSTLITQAQHSDSSGSSYIQSNTLTLDSGGTVTGSSQYNSPGSLQPSTSNPDLLVPVAAPVGTTPAISTAPTAPAAAPVVFPSDYARQGEAATAATQVITADAARDTAAAQLSPSVMPPQLDTSLSNRENIPNEISSIATGPDLFTAPSLFQPFQPAACEPLSFHFTDRLTNNDHPVVLNICPYIDPIKNIFSWIVYLTTAGLLFGMFTRRLDVGGS